MLSTFPLNFALFIFLNLSFVSISHATVTPPKTQCFIEIDNVHISTSLYERNLQRSIKVNASSRCNRIQQQVTLTVELLKVGEFEDHLVAETTKKSAQPIPAGKLFFNQNTAHECLNRRMTRYYGVAISRAIIGGKSYETLEVRSETTTLIPCGT